MKQGQPLASAGSSGLPVQIFPGEVNVTCLGCPLLRYAQTFFIDMGTNTQTDGLYNVTGITHNFTPGVYDTSIKFPVYNKYNSLAGPREYIAGLQQLTDILGNR
jgi:hypothetical protein